MLGPTSTATSITRRLVRTGRAGNRSERLGETGLRSRRQLITRRLRGSGYGRGKQLARPRSWAISLAVCVALTTAGALAAHAEIERSQPPSPGYVPEPGVLTLVYDVEVLGIPAMTARFEISYRADTYDMALVLSTVGLIDWLANWKMSMNARGVLKNLAVVPERYHETRSKRALEMIYAAGKIVAAPKTPPSASSQREEVAEAARTKAADLLSLTLAAMLSINEGLRCNYRGILFDGNRLFDLAVIPNAGSEARSAAINGFTPPLACVFEFQRRAYQADQSNPDKVLHDHDPQIYRVWLSRFAANGPMVPVKLVFDLDIGAVHATLSQSRSQLSRTTGP